MGMTMTATFYESWLRTVGSLPMRLMGVAIIEFNAVGERELADELTRIRSRWAQLVARRAKRAAEPERLQHVAQVIEASMFAPDKPRPPLEYRDARRHVPARREVRDAG